MHILATALFFIFEVISDWWACTPEPKNKFGSKLHKYITRVMIVVIPVSVLYLLYLWITL